MHAAGQGISCDNPRLDFPKVIARENEVVARHAQGAGFLMKKNKVDWIKGYGKLASPGKVQVESAGGGVQVLETRNIIIGGGPV